MYVSEIFARDIGTGPMENGNFLRRDPNNFLIYPHCSKILHFESTTTSD
jgi:hypothetical protein